MKLSDRGILEIAEHEGIVPAPYLDSKGIWTFGVGHTAAAGDPDPARMPRGMPADIDAAIDQALKVFARDVASYEDRVRRAIKVPLKQHEFDALVSFDFNTGGIFKARLTERINAGDRHAAESFMGWLKPPEIRKRRTAEMTLYQTGDYDRNGRTVPIWNVDGAGKLRGVAATADGETLLRRMRTLAPPAPEPLPAENIFAVDWDDLPGPIVIPSPLEPDPDSLEARVAALEGFARRLSGITFGKE